MCKILKKRNRIINLRTVLYYFLFQNSLFIEGLGYIEKLKKLMFTQSLIFQTAHLIFGRLNKNTKVSTFAISNFFASPTLRSGRDNYGEQIV